MTQPFDPEETDNAFVLDTYDLSYAPPTHHFSGEQAVRPVVLIEHLGVVGGFDLFSAALKVRASSLNEDDESWSRVLVVEGSEAVRGNLLEAYALPLPDPYETPAYRHAMNVRPARTVGVNIAPLDVHDAHLDVRQDGDTVGLQVYAESETVANMIQALTPDEVAQFVINSLGELLEGQNAYFYGTGVQVGSNTSDFGGGVKVIGLDNATTLPSTNPTDGVVLYAEGGRMRYRDHDGNRWRWPVGNPIPELHDLLAWAYDPVGALSSAEFNAGTIYLAKVQFHRNTQPSTVRFHVTNQANAATDSFVGVYSAAGTLLTTSADISSMLNTTGTKTATLLSPPNMPPDYYYVAFLCGATPGQGPRLATAGAPGTVGNVNLSGASLRFATGPTGQTSLPSSITMSGLVASDRQTWLGVAP